MAVPPIMQALIRWTSPARRPPRVARGRVRRCSRCDLPFLAMEDPDARWFLACPTCRSESHRVLLALLVAFTMGGCLVLMLQP